MTFLETKGRCEFSFFPVRRAHGPEPAEGDFRFSIGAPCAAPVASSIAPFSGKIDEGIAARDSANRNSKIENRKSPRAFSLVELMIGLAISTVIFGAILGALSSIEKCFLASNQYSQANSDEQRVMDYIGRDLRGAYTVAISSTSQSITLTLPDYYGGQYDAQGNPTGVPVTPTITNGVVNYGSSTQPLTVIYYLLGASLVRKQTVGATGAVSNVIVSSNVEDLQTAFVDLTSVVQFTVTFLPIYDWGAESTAAQAGATLTAVVSVRNARRD